MSPRSARLEGRRPGDGWADRAQGDVTCLVAAAKAGDGPALDELCRRLYPQVKRFFAQLLPAEAEDLTQDLFARLGARLRDYQESGQFGAWLRTVGYNLYRTRRRSLERRREDTLKTGVDPVDLQTTSIFQTGKRALRAAVNNLPASLRDAWELFALGYQPRDIAAKLQITPAAAATRVSRAKVLLLEQLSRRR
jgi:RNA polymerase sigma-70 factor (ECF subfamily)